MHTMVAPGCCLWTGLATDPRNFAADWLLLPKSLSQYPCCRVGDEGAAPHGEVVGSSHFPAGNEAAEPVHPRAPPLDQPWRAWSSGVRSRRPARTAPASAGRARQCWSCWGGGVARPYGVCGPGGWPVSGLGWRARRASP
jgi:hypothetical protein